MNSSKPHPQIRATRPLTREDLTILSEPRAPGSRINRIKDLHHRLARLFAFGYSVEEVSAITGVSQPRLHNYRTDPAFEQLIAEYRPKISAVDVEKYDYIRDVATTTLRNVVEMVAEEVEEAINSGERIPMRQLLPLIRDYGDRFGYGKHTHNTNTQVTFAIEMEEARIRTERARTIEGSASPSLPQTRVSEPHPTYSPESLQPVVASAGLPRRV